MSRQQEIAQIVLEILEEPISEKSINEIINNVSSTNLEQSKLCVNSPLYIDTRLFCGTSNRPQ